MYPMTTVISSLYDEQKESDGFMYIEISEESTFGH